MDNEVYIAMTELYMAMLHMMTQRSLCEEEALLHQQLSKTLTTVTKAQELSFLAHMRDTLGEEGAPVDG